MKYLLMAILIVANGGALPGADSGLLTMAPQSCASLASLRLPDTTITLAQTIAAGAFRLPTPAGGAPAAGAQEAIQRSAGFCRVAADDEAVQRFRHQDRSMAAGVGLERQVPGNRQRRVCRRAATLSASLTRVSRGYATRPRTPVTQTRTARAQDGRWHHPEKIVDFGYRAVHETAVSAKAIIRAFYGDARQAVLLQFVLQRRQAGADGGAAVSRPTTTASSPAHPPTTGRPCYRLRLRMPRRRWRKRRVTSRRRSCRR